jgi:uncharacterized protein
MLLGNIKEIWRYPVKSMAGESLMSSAVGSLGLPGDRGWAIRDEQTGEITNGKRCPVLMQSSARYLDDSVTRVEMEFPDGSRLASDAVDVNDRLSSLMGHPVTLWPRQPAEDLKFYRRRSWTARAFGRLARFGPFRAALPALTSFGYPNRELRKAFSREPGEPVPDVSLLPPEILEFSSPPGTFFDAFPIHLVTTASLGVLERLNPAARWDVRRFRPNFLIETTPAIETMIEREWQGQLLRIGEVELRCEISTPRCGMTIQAQKDFPKDPSILRTIVRDANQNLGIYANVVSPGMVKLGDQVELATDSHG